MSNPSEFASKRPFRRRFRGTKNESRSGAALNAKNPEGMQVGEGVTAALSTKFNSWQSAHCRHKEPSKRKNHLQCAIQTKAIEKCQTSLKKAAATEAQSLTRCSGTSSRSQSFTLSKDSRCLKAINVRSRRLSIQWKARGSTKVRR